MKNTRRLWGCRLYTGQANLGPPAVGSRAVSPPPQGRFSRAFYSPPPCLPPLAQIISIDGSSLANYFWLVFTKSVAGILDRSSPREPSSRKFFRNIDSGYIRLPPFFVLQENAVLPTAFPGSPAILPERGLGETVVKNIRDVCGGLRPGIITNRWAWRKLLSLPRLGFLV